ncbi:MAG: hypothetical protein J6B43_04740 [Lachnospiraceae bacterium]|nr:hypothetical protein [Lachnospiraceae bacterium]
MKKQREAAGYFTVEAALVLPIVMSVYVFLITMLFLQYDRCLLEQDMAAMLLKVSSEPGTPQQQLEYLQKLTAEWDREKYLWLQLRPPHFTVQGQQIRLAAEGLYTVPVYDSLGNAGGEHRLEVTYSLNTWNRAELARIFAGGHAEVRGGTGQNCGR